MARIVLAEDESAVRAFVKRALEQDGHVVIEAEDGALALEILQRETEPFDLLLSDIRMPMMDGIALALAAARDFPDLPIILMTGYADQRERAADLQALIEDVISKPFQLADLRALVQQTLAKRAPAADSLLHERQQQMMRNGERLRRSKALGMLIGEHGADFIAAEPAGVLQLLPVDGDVG